MTGTSEFGHFDRQVVVIGGCGHVGLPCDARGVVFRFETQRHEVTVRWGVKRVAGHLAGA